MQRLWLSPRGPQVLIPCALRQTIRQHARRVKADSNGKDFAKSRGIHHRKRATKPIAEPEPTESDGTTRLTPVPSKKKNKKNRAQAPRRGNLTERLRRLRPHLRNGPATIVRHNLRAALHGALIIVHVHRERGAPVRPGAPATVEAGRLKYITAGCLPARADLPAISHHIGKVGLAREYI